jgi:galactonate dehydratase
LNFLNRIFEEVCDENYRHRTAVVSNPWKNWHFIIIETDEGISGLGKATGPLITKPFEAAVLEIRRLWVDEDPRRVTTLWQKLFEALYLPSHLVPLQALAGIEVACWDILGKSLGQPVHALLGGKVRDRIRVYANGCYQVPQDPVIWREKARGMWSER